MRLRVVVILSCALIAIGCAVDESPHGDVQPDAARSVAIEDSQFISGRQRQRLLLLDRLARQTAESGWHHEPWHWSEQYDDYRATWCRTVDERGRCRTTAPDKAPVHQILLMAGTEDRQPGVIRDISLSVDYYPRKDAWGGRLSWSCNIRPNVEGPAVSMGLNFVRQRTEEREYLELDPSRSVCFLTKRFGNRIYRYGVWGQSWRRSPLWMVDSPETLRTTGLSLLDNLEDELRTAARENRLVQSVQDESILVPADYGKGGEIIRQAPKKFMPPFPEVYELTADEQQKILDEALAEVDRRRTLIEQHHDEMHDNLTEAFPLRPFLSEFADEQ